MSESIDFQLTFLNPCGVCFSGQPAIGKVDVVLKEPTTLRQIYLTVKGLASVYWSEGENSNFYDSQELINMQVVLLSSDNGSVTLPAGSHQYPFNFSIPEMMPSSFEGVYGLIRYTAEATFELRLSSRKADKITSSTEFTVVHNVDLNEESFALYKEGSEEKAIEKAARVRWAFSSPAAFSEVGIPYRAHADKDVTCCCTAGSIRAEFTLNKLCFVPGEPVIVSNCSIHNRQNGPVDDIRICLEQEVLYTAQGATKRTVYFLADVCYGAVVPRGHSLVLNNIALPIPPVVPSKLGICVIIKISYSIKLRCSSSGVCFGPEIIIGTIPLGNAEHITSPSDITITTQPQRQPAPSFATPSAGTERSTTSNEGHLNYGLLAD